ncbi:MAG TPA: VOC family protein [Ktedonobacterales bacterium]
MSNHPIVHIEIPGTDTKAAAKFYEDAFGWNIQTDPSFEGYPMFQAEGGPGGGFVKPGEAMGVSYKVGEVLIYIDTDDIEASLAKVQSLGGKVVLPKTDIPQVGWFAVFADPTGNKIGLFTTLPHKH